MSRVAEISEHARERASRAHEKASRKIHKLERKLERASKKLPVDTPLDKRRRHRNVKRAEKGGGLGALVALVVGGAAFVVWRARRVLQPDQTPATSPGSVRQTNGEGTPQHTARVKT